MKIALCLEYPIDQHGGTEVLVSELILGLAKKHQVILVSPDDTASLARSKVAAAVAGHISFLPVWSSVSAQALAGKIADAKPDIAHFHFGGNYGWGNRVFWKCPVVHLRKSGVPCLSTNHGAFSILEGYCWEKRPLAVKLALLPPAWVSKQFVLTRLATEVAVSQNDYRALRRWYPLLRGKFRWIYHSRLHGTPPPPNPDRQKVIVCAGTIGPRKAQPLLAEAFARIAKKFPDWQLIFIGRSGDDALLKQIQRTITQGGLDNQVKLLGARSDAELREWLQRAAIFAMPSTYEGLGLSLQEAQFYGCACVATRSGGVSDLIEDGDNGLLVDVNNPAQLAKALERLMGDEKLRERFSRRSPESVLAKGMTADRMVEKHEQFYAEILKRKPMPNA
jgi:glycosyltransferase involved in cell wall biosynthesis